MALADRPWQPEFMRLHCLFAPLACLEINFSHFQEFPSLEFLNSLAAARRLLNTSGEPLCFAAAGPKRRRQRGKLQMPTYEQIIHETHAIPTRPNSWHDLFNALSWLLYPATKLALMQRRLDTTEPISTEAARAGRVRNREQERLAMFDEAGLIIINMPARLPQAIIFGHAIWEHAIAGNLSTTGLGLPIHLDTATTDELSVRIKAADLEVAKKVSEGFLATYESKGEALQSWLTT